MGPTSLTQNPPWGLLTTRQKRLVSTAIIAGLLQFFAVDFYFRLQQLSIINQYLAGNSGGLPSDGIRFLPLDASVVAYAALISGSALVVHSKAKNRAGLGFVLLGSAWVLASVPLMFDFLIDSFELKLPIAVLFVYSGVRYWKGNRNNPFSFVLAPLVTIIATLDGISHLSGSFCGQNGLDSCAAKAVSDTYLVIILLGLMYLTMSGRDRRPSLRLILIAVLAPILTVLGLAFFP